MGGREGGERERKGKGKEGGEKGGEGSGKGREGEGGRGKVGKGMGRTPHCFLDKSNPDLTATA